MHNKAMSDEGHLLGLILWENQNTWTPLICELYEFKSYKMGSKERTKSIKYE